jgi:uncharacterized protein (TIGR02270 family)
MLTRRYTGWSPAETSRRVVPDIVEAHAGDAAFLWLSRRKAAHSIRYRLIDLARADERVEAHLEGSAVAGRDAWSVLAEGLEESSPGAVFAACVVALRHDDQERLHDALAYIGSSAECMEAAVSAFGWVQCGGTEGPPRPPLWGLEWARKLLAAQRTVQRSLAVGLLTACRLRPNAQLLDLMLSDDADEDTMVASARMLGVLGLRDEAPTLEKLLDHRAAAVRSSAAWSMLRMQLRHPKLSNAVRDALRAREPPVATLDFAARSSPPQQLSEWCAELVARDQLRAAIKVIAAGGWTAHVDRLIELMAVPSAARLAGWAFTQIQGCDILRFGLDAPTSDDEAVTSEQDPTGADVAEEHLPLPDPARVAAWWHARRNDYARGARYLAGQPIQEATLREILVSGVQPQRRSAALELAAARPDTVLYNVSAPGFAQARTLLGWQ